MAMTIWLLDVSSSATSRACLAIGCLVILAIHRKKMPRYARLLKLLIPVTFLLYVTLAFGFGMLGDFAATVGRDPTLTDRTKIWSVLLSVKINPVVGTGYESFWLGSRLDQVWAQWPGINEAHNGYLAVYLNLGLLGLFILSAFLIASYRNIWKGLNRASSLGSFTLGVWTVLMFYNLTEAALGTGVLWLALLPGALAPTELVENEVQVAASDNADATEGLPSLPAKATGQWR
jgi:O-antigen ligase